MSTHQRRAISSEIATITFSGGDDAGSSSDASSVGFEDLEVPTVIDNKGDLQQHKDHAHYASSNNPFDSGADEHYDSSKNPFHSDEAVHVKSKNPFESPEQTDSREKNLFNDNTETTLNVDKNNPFDDDNEQENGEVSRSTGGQSNDTDVRSSGKDLLTTDRCNPFDTDSDGIGEDNDWWENQVTKTDNRQKIFTEKENLDISEDHFSLPEGYMSMTSVNELEKAITNCKEVVLKCAGQSDKQKEMVNKLIQLRLKLIEAKEGPQEPDPDVKHVVGHKFMKKEGSSAKHYCEKCNTMIWGVLQHWYRCTACGFCVHDKCLNLITRTCASLQVAEHAQYVLSICPERGLSQQNYKCTECRTAISYQAGFGEPRQCDYTGYYYCDLCHWNDQMSIPARIVHNWDFEPRKVCRAAKQFLKLMCKKPVLRIQDINPMLFSFVEELNQVKKLREEILIMKKYFLSCKLALRSKLLLLRLISAQRQTLRCDIRDYFRSSLVHGHGKDHYTTETPVCKKTMLVRRQHFVENSDMYSLQDLLDTAADLLMPELARIHTSFAQHIKTDCQPLTAGLLSLCFGHPGELVVAGTVSRLYIRNQICQGKGYVCELCDYKEILFPFDNHAIVCAKCSTVLHRHCFARRNQQCPKCERMNKRSVGDESS